MAPFGRPYKTFYWSAIVTIALSCVKFQDLRFGTNVRVRVFPCGTYVNFYGLARVAIQGLTWVNF